MPLASLCKDLGEQFAWNLNQILGFDADRYFFHRSPFQSGPTPRKSTLDFDPRDIPGTLLWCIGSHTLMRPLHSLGKRLLICTISHFSLLCLTISSSRKRAEAHLQRFLYNFLVLDSTGMCRRCSISPSGSIQLSLPGLDWLRPLWRRLVQTG